MLDDVEQARVVDDAAEPHGTLFPLAGFSRTTPTAAALCEWIGLNWQSALWLHDKGWLSFDPAATESLARSQTAELRFLGSLVAAGCDEHLLRTMLRGLRRPYAYRIELMHYAWEEQVWRVLPGEREQRRRFVSWIETLEDSASIESLEGIRERVDKAIHEVQSWGTY